MAPIGWGQKVLVSQTKKLPVGCIRVRWPLKSIQPLGKLASCWEMGDPREIRENSDLAKILFFFVRVASSNQLDIQILNDYIGVKNLKSSGWAPELPVHAGTFCVHNCLSRVIKVHMTKNKYMNLINLFLLYLNLIFSYIPMQQNLYWFANLLPTKKK